jgi:hypothetical protein
MRDAASVFELPPRPVLDRLRQVHRLDCLTPRLPSPVCRYTHGRRRNTQRLVLSARLVLPLRNG